MMQIGPAQHASLSQIAQVDPLPRTASPIHSSAGSASKVCCRNISGLQRELLCKLVEALSAITVAII
jgi:hypothetical protein